MKRCICFFYGLLLFFGAYPAFDATAKDIVTASLQGKNYASAGDIESAFDEAVLLQMINDVTSFTDLKILLEQYQNELSLDLETYYTLSSAKQDTVAKQLTNQNFNSLNQFRQLFTSTVSTAATKSGGSGGGTTPYFITVEITDADNNLLDIVSDNQQVYLAVTAENVSYEGTTPTVVVGLYSSRNQLKSIIMAESVVLELNQSQTYHLPCVVNSDDSVKTFVLDGLCSLKPVTYERITPVMEPIPETAVPVRAYITEIGENADGYMSVAVKEQFTDGQWVVSEQTLFVDTYDKDVFPSLGCYVQLYVEITDTGTYLYKNPVILSGDTVTACINDISYSGSAIMDFSSGEIKTYDIASSAVIYYNNRLAPDFSLQNLYSYKNANIRLLNNSAGSSAYNIIFIDDYTDNLVSTVDSTSNSVIFEDGTSLAITWPAKIIRDKREILLSDLEPGCVLSILGTISESGILENGVATVTGKKITGLVEEYTNAFIGIDSVRYPVTYNIYEKFYNDELRLGYTITAYFNSRDRVSNVVFDKHEHLNYAFATVMHKTTRFGIEGYSISLLRENGEWEDYAVPANVIVNSTAASIPIGGSGGSGSGATPIIDWNTAIGYIGDSNVMNTVDPSARTAAYVINKVIAYQGRYLYFIPTIDAEDMFYAAVNSNCVYDAATGQFGNYTLDDNTVIFSVNYTEVGSNEYSIPVTAELDSHRDVIKVDKRIVLTDEQFIDRLTIYNPDKENAADVLMGKGIIY